MLIHPYKRQISRFLHASQRNFFHFPNALSPPALMISTRLRTPGYRARKPVACPPELTTCKMDIDKAKYVHLPLYLLPDMLAIMQTHITQKNRINNAAAVIQSRVVARLTCYLPDFNILKGSLSKLNGTKSH